MAKRLLTFSMLLCSLMNLNAQDLGIKWGGPTKSNNVVNNSFEPLGWQGDKAFYILGSKFRPMGVYALYGVNYKINLEKISKTGRGMTSKELVFDHKRNNFIHGMLKNDLIYVLGSKSKKKRYSLFYEVYDLNGRPKLSREFDSYRMGLVDYLYATERLVTSPNDSLHTYILVHRKRKKDPPGLHITLHSFNSKFGKHKRSDIKIKEASHEYTLVDYKLDNEGNTALLFKQTKEKDDEPELFFYLVNAEGELVQEAKLALENYYFAKPKLIVNQASRYRLAAFYYNLNKNKKAYQGFILSDLDTQAGELTNISTRPFGEEMLRYYGLKKGKSSVKFRGDFELEYILKDEENGHLLAEREYYETHENSTVYFQKEVIASAFNAENQLSEMSLVPKNQSANFKNQNSMGYHAFYWKDKLYLTYNDHKKNVDNGKKKKKAKELKGPKDNDSATILSSIDKEGNVNREVWFENSRADGYLVPEKCYTDGDIKFIGVASGSKTKFGIIQTAKKKSRTKRKRKKK